MSKNYENLDNLILSGQQDMIDFDPNEVESKPTDADKTSQESETKLEIESKDDGKIDLDLIDDETKASEKKKESTKEVEKIETEETPEAETQEEIQQDPKEVLTHWSNYFKENSILAEEDLEGFDGSMESLSKAFERREERTGLEMVESYKSQLPDVVKYLAENWEEGVPLNDLLNIKSNQIKYAAVTDEKLEESVDTQKMIISDFLRKTTKFSETKIQKEVDRLQDLEELKAEAKEALGELKKIEVDAEETLRKETKKEQERRKDENYKLIKSYEKASKDLKEIVPGIKLSEKEQKEVFDKAVNPIAIDGNGNPVSYIQSLRNPDPIAFDLKANWFAMVTKGYTDFSKITNTATTKATKELSNILNSPVPKNGKDGLSVETKKNMLDYLSMNENKKQFKK